VGESGLWWATDPHDLHHAQHAPHGHVVRELLVHAAPRSRAISSRCDDAVRWQPRDRQRAIVVKAVDARAPVKSPGRIERAGGAMQSPRRVERAGCGAALVERGCMCGVQDGCRARPLSSRAPIDRRQLCRGSEHVPGAAARCAARRRAGVAAALRADRGASASVVRIAQRRADAERRRRRRVAGGEHTRARLAVETNQL